MLTKATIVQKTADNEYIVSIQLFTASNAQGSPFTATAYPVARPGEAPIYDIGENVWVSFEENNAGKPIILGKVYVNQESAFESNKTALLLDTLKVNTNLTIPISTKISYTNSNQATKTYNSLAEVVDAINNINSGSKTATESEIATKALIKDVLKTIVPKSVYSESTLNAPITIFGGNQSNVNKLILDQSNSGQITDNSTSTLLGFMNSSDLTVGSGTYNLRLRGKESRPKYTYNNTNYDIALSSDLTNFITNPTTQITLSSGTPLKFTALGDGTYNQAAFVCNTTDGIGFEAPMTTDSISGDKLPITFSWRGGSASMGGFKVTSDGAYEKIGSNDWKKLATTETVSGTSSGDNWTSITIGTTTKNIPSSWSMTTTSGSEAISDGSTNTLNLVTRDTQQTISGSKTFTGQVGNTQTTAGVYLGLDSNSSPNANIAIVSENTAAYIDMGRPNTDYDFRIIKWNTTNNTNAQFVYGGNASGTITIPKKTGTIALTDDLSGYVATTGDQSIGGNKTFSNSTTFSNNVSIGGYLSKGSLIYNLPSSSGRLVVDSELPDITFSASTVSGASALKSITCGTDSWSIGTHLYLHTITSNASTIYVISTASAAATSWIRVMLLLGTGFICGYYGSEQQKIISYTSTNYTLHYWTTSTSGVTASKVALSSYTFSSDTVTKL